MAETGRKLADGVRLLGEIKDEDVRIATTPKDEVMRRDKTALYRYRPVAKPSIKLPVLVAYGLIGRYTMADLQDDRSLIRNLLAQGVDVYVVDWGNPSRSDRWLTLEDYVDGYLGDCVDHIRAAHGVDEVNLLGICEGGVFTLCYAALHPRRVRNLAGRRSRRSISTPTWTATGSSTASSICGRAASRPRTSTRSSTPGYVPGKFMGMVFSMMTPVRSLTKYNLDMLDVFESATG